jgi:hypothetical protein
VIFKCTARGKQSPRWRKFAKSSHPVSAPSCQITTLCTYGWPHHHHRDRISFRLGSPRQR